MSVFAEKGQGLLSKAKIAWKTLVVLILSVLLFAPTPALALDYNGTLQSYVSNTKVEIDGVLTSIKKLPSQSYENGKTTLAEIDNKLQNIQTNAGKNAKNFHNLSAQAQKEYEQVINQINNLKPPVLQPTKHPVQGIINNFTVPLMSLAFNLAFQMTDEYKVQESKNREDYEYRKAVYRANQENLEFYKQRLASGIVLTNKISNLCDDLEKRVNLAKQKSGNVKEYADALNSFNDPDILSEINELNNLVANLTKNLTLAV